jgi:hypothetical protein
VRHLCLGRGDADVLRYDWAFPASALRRLEIDFACLMRLPHRFVALLGGAGGQGSMKGGSRSMLASVVICNARIALPESAGTLERKSTLSHGVLALLARLPWLSRLTVEAVLGRRVLAHALAAAASGATSFARLERADVWLRASLAPVLVKLLDKPMPASSLLTELAIHLSRNDGPVLAVIATHLRTLRSLHVHYRAEPTVLAADEIASLSVLSELRSLMLIAAQYRHDVINAQAFTNGHLIRLITSLRSLRQLHLRVTTSIDDDELPKSRERGRVIDFNVFNTRYSTWYDWYVPES